MLLFIHRRCFDVLDHFDCGVHPVASVPLGEGDGGGEIFLAGIFTIYLAWLLMKAFDMRLISSILGQFMGVGVIALLIVFQQELRRFLLLLGSRYNLQNIFNVNKIFSKPTISEEVAEEVAKACVNFSATKTGADPHQDVL